MTWGKIGARFFGRVFSKNASEVTQAALRKTTSYTNSMTGVTTLEREITYKGNNAIARIDQWVENGKRMSKIQIETEGRHIPLYRTKSIKEEAGKSLYGGNKITIEKDTTLHWCHNDKTTLSKEYNTQGQLEHKEYIFNRNIGNEKFIHKTAVQDRVYDEFPLTSSVENMLVNPAENRYFQHMLDNQNNYNRFAQQGTKYERTLEANKKAAQEAAKKAEEEAAAKLAAEEAAKKAEEKILPRINSMKALGVDIKTLKRAERTLADGSIERTYFSPDSNKILLKTVDKGILHKEWIYDSKHADMIYMKQVGRETPYILAKKGSSTQILGEKLDINSQSGLPYLSTQTGRLSTTSLDGLYRFDGIYSVKYNPHGIGINGQVASIKMPYQYHPEYLNSNESWRKIIDKQFAKSTSKLASEPVNSSGNRIHRNPYDSRIDSKLSPELKDAYDAAKSDFVDLKDLYKPFES